jgi:hypothetical protein
MSAPSEREETAREETKHIAGNLKGREVRGGRGLLEELGG